MWDKYKHLNKLMLTFTFKDDNKYFKMQVINEIKNYITKLIRNTKNQNIKYYANIELGEYYDNPHLHIQFFYDDLKQILAIRSKVITKFGLVDEYCNISIPERDGVRYDYVIKDYSNKINDEDLLLLDSIKKDYRNILDKKLRFNSFTKEKYTKVTYKLAYSKGITKGNVDFLIENFIINTEIEIIDKILKKYVLLMVLSVLIQYIEQVSKLDGYLLSNGLEVKKAIHQTRFLSLLWIYGFT